MLELVATPMARAGIFRPELSALAVRLSPAVRDRIILPIDLTANPEPQPAPPPPPPDMPMLGSQTGHLFNGWPTDDVRWYLPDFVLANDPDPSFAFAATQSGVDSSGNPFNKLRLTLGLKKIIPQDVAALKAAQPTVALKEIWLGLQSATLALSFNDSATGAAQQAMIPGSITVTQDGSLDVVFENILGVNVIILFENLRNGGAVLNLSADYTGWRRTDRSVPRDFTRAVVSEAAIHPLIAGQQQRPMIMFRPQPFPGPLPPIILTQPGLTNAAISYAMPLGQKYAASTYLLKYTITGEGPPRSIIGVDDLRDYNNKQSEFRPLHELGDVSQRYPSVSRLYLGVLSRTIVVIPARYAITRLINACAASCQVLLDSAAETRGAKFQFQFLLAADLSPIDLVGLAMELDGHPDLKDCAVTTPSMLRAGGSAFDTIFKSSAEFSIGSILHSFALSVEIVDAATDSPAVATANLLIRLLCASKQPYVSGTLDLTLDNALTDRIQVPFVLNFRDTVGNEGLMVVIDDAASMISVTNHSAFDLDLQRYALSTHSGLTASSLGKVLRINESLSLSSGGDHTGVNMLIDAQIMFDETPLIDVGLPKYLDIHMQDVQSVHCMFGFNAGAVAFGSRGIAKIDALISFGELPGVAPIALAVTKDSKIASADVPVPIRALIGSLGATMGLTIHYEDVHRPDDDLSLTNDFIQSPIFTLLDSALH